MNNISNRTKGILCIICAAFCFAFMNAFVKLAGDLPSIEKSFFRNFVALIIAFFVLIKKKEGFHIVKGAFICLFLRSFFGTIGILCNFYAIDHLVISDASMLNKMSPFFAIIFSYFILKEKLTLRQGLIVITAFIGSLFIIKPTFSNASLFPSVLGLIGGMGAGIAYTMVRILGKKGQHASFVVFFFSGFSCLVTLPYLIFNYHPMTKMQLISLLLAGVSAAGGQYSITAAYMFAPAKEISVYDYSQIIFAAILGFIMFGQTPDIFSVIGYVIIISVAIINYKLSFKASHEQKILPNSASVLK